MKIAPGKMVTRHVRLVQPIGEGAMGTVWQAEHLTLHTRVAVKFISADLAKDNPDVLARFQQEASASAQIKSSHVVQVYDHGLTDEGTPYIVMEYLEGESLGSRLNRNDRITMRQTAQVLVQAGKALDAAHQLGIIHRDIKPDNIFLSTAEEGLICKVLDFGIAKHTKLADQKGVTLPGTTVGTPEYMSREQVMTACDVDSSADRWALAVVAYQCLTGVLPFDGETLAMVCVAICGGKFEAPSSLCEDLPPEVDTWFERALHKDPAQRFDSCKQMALDFMRVVPKIEDEDSWVQSGEFSLPPPSSGEAMQIDKLPPLGGEALLAELAGAQEGKLRRDTPTFTGSSAELVAPTARTGSWRRPAVGVMGAVALLAIGVTVAIVLTTSNGQQTEPAPGATAAPGETTNAAEQGTTATSTPSAWAATQATVTADASAPRPSTRPKGRLPRRPDPYEPAKPPRRDLGF